MSKTISKIGKLKHPESYIQANLIKGFKYVDRAGELVNMYAVKDAAPKFNMGLNGLDLFQPLNNVEQLKVTPYSIWMKFVEIGSLDSVTQVFNRESAKLIKVLEVEKLNRLGWRNYFVHEFQNQDEQKNYMKKFGVLPNANPVMIRMEIKTDKNFDGNIMIQPVVRGDDNEKKVYGVLFDIDLFKNENILVADIPKHLKGFRDYLGDENGFLSLVNSTFE